MKQEELSEALRLHELWIKGDKEGVRANLFRADLSGADLSGADLSRAYLTGADLTDADLTEADLTGSDLTLADLTGAYLTGANLTNANLFDTVGNGREIKNIDTTVYKIAYTSEVIQIGCKNYTIEEWRNFSDEEISAMDEGALKWWKENKEMIFTTIEEDPATPTNKEEK